MDLERTITGGQDLGESYCFTQNSTRIVVKVPLQSRIERNLFDFFFNPTDNSIYAGIKGEKPLLCGILYGKVYNPTHNLMNTYAEIILQKEEDFMWPVLIINMNSRGIDPKSCFLLGAFYDACTDYQKARRYYEMSAMNDFVPAQVLISDLSLSKYNIYGIEYSPERAMKTLECIPPSKRDEKITLLLYRVYKLMEDEAGSLDVLRQAADKYPGLRMLLAKNISPFCGGQGDAAEAVRHLSILASQNVPEALQLLAKHTSKGVGTKKDKALAREYDRAALELDPNLTTLFPKRGKVKNTILAVSLSGGLIAASLGMWLYNKKR